MCLLDTCCYITPSYCVYELRGMSSILSRENLDLIALELDQAQLAEQVTGLELLQHFELIDGFWHACVEMVTPTSEELCGILKNTDDSSPWSNGSVEQVIDFGIRDQVGDLTASFCNWFDRHCSFDPAAGTRNFLLPHLRPAEFAELHNEGSVSRQKRVIHNSPQQMQTKFANAVIEAMNLPADLPASEIYTDFARKALELADEKQWGQDLRAEIEHGSGHLLIFYTSKGSATPVNKTITPRRFAGLLSVTRKS